MDKIDNEVSKMSYVSSKKYGAAVQHYVKSNGDISFYITYRDDTNKTIRKKIGNKSNGINENFCFQLYDYVRMILKISNILQKYITKSDFYGLKYNI